MTGERDEKTRIGRRTYLAAVGAVGVGALAGCSGGGDGGDGSDGGGGDGGSVEAPQEVADYLSETSNFDGTVADRSGNDEVRVEVGAKGNDNFWAFEPAAVRVSPGTTVVWEWTGQGNSHNVVADDGAYESDLYSEEGETFEYDFEDAGTSLYYCLPHESAGMKGAVVVE